MAQTLFYLIIGFIVFEFILAKVLDFLNYRNIDKPVPEELKDIYDEEKVAKTKAYDKEKSVFQLISSSISLVVILVVLFLDGFAWLDEFVRQYTTQPVLMSMLFFGILYIASDVMNIPFSLYGTFVIEENFGFNKVTPKLFVIDKLKNYLMAILLGGGILALITYLFTITGNNFWWIAWITIAGFSLFMMVFYTSLILPIFNKLTTLEVGGLRTDIEHYSEKVKFPLKNIFIMDGSKRSSKANAFFSGMGGKKSIVLFDTLVNDHSKEELLSILAHEVGHYKMKHVQKGFVISMLNMGILLFLFGMLAKLQLLPEILGATEQSFHLALVAFSLLYSPVSFFTGMLMNIFSRKNEYEADAYAKSTYDGTALKVALKKLSSNHLSHFNPHPAFVFFHYSHPPVVKRLRALG